MRPTAGHSAASSTPRTPTPTDTTVVGDFAHLLRDVDGWVWVLDDGRTVDRAFSP